MPVCSCPCLSKGGSITITSPASPGPVSTISPAPDAAALPPDDILVCPQELLNVLAVGSVLCLDDGEALLKVKSKMWRPADNDPGAASGRGGVCRLAAVAEVLGNLDPGAPDQMVSRRMEQAPGKNRRSEIVLRLENPGHSLAWVTLSDKGARGEREDKSGPLIEELVRQCLQLRHVQGYIIPDEEPLLRALLTDLALVQGYDLILTTGGTGVSPRDVTPEATQKILDRELPGFSAAMLLASLGKTPHAAISRAKAGTLGASLIINLPGSPKAVAENLVAVLPAIGHALDKMKGDQSDCGR